MAATLPRLGVTLYSFTPDFHAGRYTFEDLVVRAAELGLYGATFLMAMTWALAPVTHLVIVGEGAEADRMHRRALSTFVPRKVVQRYLPPHPPYPQPPPRRAQGARPRIPPGLPVPGAPDREEWASAPAG